jgi:hypothetical protein
VVLNLAEQCWRPEEIESYWRSVLVSYAVANSPAMSYHRKPRYGDVVKCISTWRTTVIGRRRGLIRSVDAEGRYGEPSYDRTTVMARWPPINRGLPPPRFNATLQKPFTVAADDLSRPPWHSYRRRDFSEDR